jgi:hypothetical protein
MKRRHVISGLVGVAVTSISTRLGAREVNDSSQFLRFKENSLVDDSLKYQSEKFDQQLEGLDPKTDRERPLVLSLVNEDTDDRDAHTTSVSKQKRSSADLEQGSNDKGSRTLKNVDFARNYDKDIFISEAEKPVLQSVFKRLKNLQKTIGYGRFNLVSFDEALVYGKRFSDIGEFTQTESAFIEKIFFANAQDYGFFGEKVSNSLTASYKKGDVHKVPYSGHYLFKHKSLDYYQKLKNDVGDNIILTSGIRSNVKQLYLFLAKTISVKGNLSRATRSIAPPGYSFHSIGDFDVGKIGWGARNFTDDFANTDEYKRMQDLGYIAIRYDKGNNLGVHFEPWHIKVV